MKIGLVADIHANRPALMAVLQELHDVDHIWCAGDITGYYPDPNGVISDLLEHHVEAIKGNHDWYLESPPSAPNAFLLQSISHTLSWIKPEYKQLLQNLPLEKNCELDGLRIKMYHGSPWDILEEYIYPDYGNLDRFAELDADIIILGHTHYPMLREIQGRVVINPGSCGQPRDGDTRAAFAVFDTQTRTVAFRRVAYNALLLKQAIRSLGLNEKLIRYLPNSGEI